MNPGPCRALFFVLALLSLSANGIFSKTDLLTPIAPSEVVDGVHSLPDGASEDKTFQQQSAWIQNTRTESQISVSSVFSARSFEKHTVTFKARLDREVGLIQCTFGQPV